MPNDRKIPHQRRKSHGEEIVEMGQEHKAMAHDKKLSQQRRKSREEEVVEMVEEHKGHHKHKIIRISQGEVDKLEAATAVQRAHPDRVPKTNSLEDPRDSPYLQPVDLDEGADPKDFNEEVWNSTHAGGRGGRRNSKQEKHPVKPQNQNKTQRKSISQNPPPVAVVPPQPKPYPNNSNRKSGASKPVKVKVVLDSRSRRLLLSQGQLSSSNLQPNSIETSIAASQVDSWMIFGKKSAMLNNNVQYKQSVLTGIATVNYDAGSNHQFPEGSTSKVNSTEELQPVEAYESGGKLFIGSEKYHHYYNSKRIPAVEPKEKKSSRNKCALIGWIILGVAGYLVIIVLAIVML